MKPKLPTHLFALPAALAIGLAGLPSAVQAQIGAEVRGQMGLGGDELASVQYSDGSQSSLKMGTYFSFSIGPILEVWQSGAHAIELQGMIGWAGWSTGPENTDDRLKLNRMPVDALAFYGYRLPGRDMSLRFGGGVTYHMIGGVSGSGSLSGFDMDLDNAMGYTAETTFISGILSTGVRYTRMNNSVTGVPGNLQGNSFGLFLGLTLPRT